ncbi:MAG: DUF1080 domain-containing protein [Bacteroidetes bacterium]|nr:DUF1080 domain-containing protein [Bacteroidota bacterium]
MQNFIKSILQLCTLFFLVMIITSSCNSSGNSDKTSENVAQKDKDGFLALFDGKTLNGWEGDTSIWKVKDGIITGEEDSTSNLKANTFLILKASRPGDFELITDYRISKGGNSGIQYRSDTVSGVQFGLKGYQADIDGENSYTGQNYEERGRSTLAYRGQKVTIPFSPDAQSKNNAWSAMIVDSSLGNIDSLKTKINEGWNECHLIIKGNHLQHYINGILMSDVTDNDTANRKMSGLIGLQIHAGHIMKVEYKNIRIKE